MTKILFSLDSNFYSQNLIRIVDQLLDHSSFRHLYTGIISYSTVDPLMFREDFPDLFSIKNPFYSYRNSDELMQEEESGKLEQVIDFKKKVKGSGVRYELHLEQGPLIEEALKEMEFSDLFALSFEKSDLQSKEQLKLFLNFGLSDLLLVPKDQLEIENLILVFDGTIEAVRTVKKFSLLFRYASEHFKIHLINVMPESEEEVRREKLFMELLRAKFSNLGVLPVKKSNLEETIYTLSRNISNPLLVLKDIFASSLDSSEISDRLISWNVPLFIAKN